MTISQVDIKSIKGLSENEAAERLKKDGYNELPRVQRRRSILKIIRDIIIEPMFILLLACGSIYFVLGDAEEAVMLMGFVFIIIGITTFQEGRSERAIEALRDLSSPRALVIRNGCEKRIAGRDVVKGDIVILREGDRIPADAALMWGINMTVDESLLTGESAPVRKEARAPLYSGSLVVSGQGVAVVTETGPDTKIGKIGKSLAAIKGEKTLLQKETAKLVKNVFIVAGVLCGAVVVIYGLTRGEWLGGMLSGITLAMAMLPEEFPVVLIIFLALGAWRISKKNVLTRKVAAVETLGSATVLCVDKTGTLTANSMIIKKLFSGGKFCDVQADARRLPEEFHEIVEYGILASKKDPFDPMEKALKELGVETLYDTEHMHAEWPLVEEYPLSKKTMALSHVWATPDGRGYIVSAKGSPEAVMDLCHLGEAEKKLLVENIHEMAKGGLRVIGVAKSFFAREKLPRSQHDFDFKFLGLIGLEDPVRPAVPAAILECYGAGIRVIMMTGDYPATAQNVAREIGLKNPDEFVTGRELETIGREELREKVRRVNIFSRVLPEQKLLIVEALKANGEIVAMTGDGVNDAPALKASNIGVAMGIRGTDVAREEASLVLLDDDFSSIVEAVRSGRRIFDNLKKAMAYVISAHVPIAGASLVPVIMKWPLVLYPVHIVFLELIIDPACSIVFESEPAERGVMERPPRDPKKPLFSKNLFVLSVLQGFFSLAAVLSVFMIAMRSGMTEAEARTMSVMTLVASNICLIFTNRSWSRTIASTLFVWNKALAGVVALAAFSLALAIHVPFLRKLFYFEHISTANVFMTFCVGILSVAWFELVKIISKKLA